MKILGVLLASTLLAGAAHAATTIDFASYGPGALSSAQGVAFSLEGGPEAGTTPVVGYGFFDSVLSLNNSATVDPGGSGYPTAARLKFSFGTAANNVSFTFNNYGSGNGSNYTAFDGLGNVISSGLIDDGSSFGTYSVGGSGIKSLVLDNATGGGNSWIFGVGQLNFSAVPEPATWGMMIVGFGLVGGLARRRAGRPVVTA